jgi:radical SAM protein with 4Fe4S-binding SPASM domain
MDCGVETAREATTECLARLRRKAAAAKLPLTGAFDLTYRCNLRCVHCYAGHLSAQPEAQAAELGTAGVLRLVDEAAGSGCLYLLLSGGEPLLRSDFAAVYRHFRRRGLVVTVFTNATTLTEEHLRAFCDFPPHQVEVSLYGATAATYQAVSQVAGSFQRALSGIERLRAAGLRVGLKTMILQRNAHEVAAMEALAAALGLRFRVDPLVTPRLDGGKEPLAQRLAPAVAAALELGSPGRREETAAYVRGRNPSGDGERLYRCGAGLTSFHLDPQGMLRPCLTSRRLAFDAAPLGLGHAWRQAVAAVEAIKVGADRQCTHCPHAALCGYCPGLFELETGAADQPPDYVCALGASRTGALDPVPGPGATAGIQVLLSQDRTEVHR